MKSFLTAILLVIFMGGFAQTDFKWDKVDSVAKTKAQIYSDTKMFIAEFWKSAQNVIQNDDKEAGMILVKGVSSQDYTFLLHPHHYKYSYTVKFLMKEGKYKLVIDNLICISATCEGNVWPLIEPTENTTKTVGGMPAAKLTEMMASLKKELQGIVDSYGTYIKTPSATKENW